ncbi:MAG: hypothetical protein HKN68_10810 [Saprospiraceae bacterium]|nr:hypothetical protein [Saprospiraceae bacterium]
MLKIISWNIRQGGGSRIGKICKSLIQEKPGIIILSEFRNNASGIKIRYELLKNGYRHQWVTGAGSNENTVLIASKMEGENRFLNHLDSAFPHNMIEVDFNAFSVIGVYLPHKKKHKLLYGLVTKMEHTDQPYIIAGDYNTGINYVDQKGKSFWYSDQLIKLQNLDFLDAFRHFHGDVKEYSWYSHQGNGYRYDHTYISNSLTSIVKDCYYLHSWREDGLSDHSPMVLMLGV